MTINTSKSQATPWQVTNLNITYLDEDEEGGDPLLHLSFLNENRDLNFIHFPVEKVGLVIRGLLDAIGEGLVPKEPETTHDDCTTKLSFNAFSRFQMGRGLVAFRQSDDEKAAGQYDPHEFFIHEHSENTDPRVLRQVEAETRLLAHLLDKFRIYNDVLSEKAKACTIEHCSPLET